MATNRDLLKEAIADAKAVKETAIANAKAALEEAFTPFLKEKLASKIQEMDEVEELELEESDLSEVEKEEKAAMKKEEMYEDEISEEISLEELLAELDAEDKISEEDTNLYEAKGEDEGEEEMSIEDMSEDDLKSFIEDVIKDMVAAGELEAGESEGEEDEEGKEEMEMDLDMEAGADEEIDEDINIDELLAEIKKDEVEEVTLDEFNPGSGAGANIDPSKNLAIKAIANALDITIDAAAAIYNQVKSGAKAVGKDLSQAAANIGGAGMSSQGVKYESELEEAYQTVKALKAELNEINLLNAKLLYTNKIFRNKSLTETQKVHVLTSFDKATTKKEVELVYETLTESLKASATKAPIKESLGSASKVLGGATSKPIIENDAFARMRELAFFGKNK